MSIYATLWKLKFPQYGEVHARCDWIMVTAQGVPAHIGSPTPGLGYEDSDPYHAFLPPPFETNPTGDYAFMRAVVFVTEETSKGTAQHPQEYVEPLLILSGQDYTHATFEDLYNRICDALRGDRPRLVAEVYTPSEGMKLLYEEGTGQKKDAERDQGER